MTAGGKRPTLAAVECTTSVLPALTMPVELPMLEGRLARVARCPIGPGACPGQRRPPIS